MSGLSALGAFGLYRVVGYSVEPLRAPSAFAAASALCEAFADDADGHPVGVTMMRNGDYRLTWTRARGFGMRPFRMTLDVTIVEERAPAGATLDGKLNPLRAGGQP